MLAGTGAADITPPIGTPLQGHFSARPESIGILAPLEIRTIAFANSRDLTSSGIPGVVDSRLSQAIVIITADLIGVTFEFTQRVRGIIERKYSISGSHILIAASHTHCGPAMLPCIGLQPKPEILAWIEAAIVESVHQAIAGLEPVTMGIGASAAHFNINRRPLPGRTEMFPNAAGVVDPRVRMMRLDRLDGLPLAVLFHYSCHPTAKNGSDGLISPDYPGIARKRIEEAMGCKAAFLPGCFGNIRPNLVNESGKFVSATAEQLQVMGNELGDAVLNGAKYIRTFDENRLAAIEQEAIFPFGPGPGGEELEKMSARREQPLRADWARRQLEKARQGAGDPAALLRRGAGAEERSVMQAVRMGPVVLVGIPGEPVQEIGLEIERQAANADLDVWAMGYCNDQVGYLCTPEMYEAGGYEPTAYVVYDRPGPFKNEERIICDQANYLLDAIAS